MDVTKGNFSCLCKRHPVNQSSFRNYGYDLWSTVAIRFTATVHICFAIAHGSLLFSLGLLPYYIGVNLAGQPSACNSRSFSLPRGVSQPLRSVTPHSR